MVTGVATRTLVVRFTEYGNHEEVLRQYTIPVLKVSEFLAVIVKSVLVNILCHWLNSVCPTFF